jgi:hypothetical protein
MFTESPFEKKKQPRGKKNEYYVQPAQFEKLIQDAYDSGVMSDPLCESIMKIAHKLSFSPNFINYSYREEMVGDAIEKMVIAIRNKVYKYNPAKVGKNGAAGNGFMYFSKIAYHAMVNRIKLEKKNRDAIENYKEELFEKIMRESDHGDMIYIESEHDEYE